MVKIIFTAKMKLKFKFSVKNYPYIVGFHANFKILIFSQFRQFLLLPKHFVCSFSAVEKRRALKFRMPLGLVGGSVCAKDLWGKDFWAPCMYDRELAARPELWLLNDISAQSSPPATGKVTDVNQQLTNQ